MRRSDPYNPRMTLLPSEPTSSRHEGRQTSRREMLRRSGLAAAAVMAGASLRGQAEPMNVLDVAYAGSIGFLMDGAVKKAAATSLKLELHGRGQGASALAQLIASGSVQPDVFIPITASPMQTVFQAGKAARAEPIARTEMVIAYSPKSRFAPRMDAAARGQEPWWKILEEPGFRFGRSDPAADPQGRNIIFVMMLAAKLYKQPDLARRVLGDTINPQQINMETGLQSRLQSGQIDAASAYRIQPGTFNLPYIPLPAEVNLSGEQVHERNAGVSLVAGGKTYVPEPLFYYAAVLNGARNPAGAKAFVQWLKGTEARTLFEQHQFESGLDAATLHA